MTPALRVYDYSASDAALFARQVDELKAGWRLLSRTIETTKTLEGETPLLWITHKLGEALAALAVWLPRGACERSAADVEDCSTGDGPLADLIHGIITASALAERYGAEGQIVRFILLGLKELAVRLDDALVNERTARQALPVAA